MDVGMYAGSFDPITLGHLDIIERASLLVKRLIVAIADNPQKTHLLSFQQRELLVKEATKHLKNVVVCRCQGLIADLAKAENANVLIRGIRCASDVDLELSMAAMNRERCGADTIFLAASPQFAHIRSRFVRDFLGQGQIPSEFIPKGIANLLRDIPL